MFLIKSQPGVLLIKVFPTKKHVMLFCSLLNMKKKLCPHDEFIFMFTPYFIGVITLRNVFKNEGFEKKSKKGDGHIEGLSIGVQTVRTLCIETSSLICFAHQWTCFYMIGTLFFPNPNTQKGWA